MTPEMLFSSLKRSVHRATAHWNKNVENNHSRKQYDMPSTVITVETATIKLLKVSTLYWKLYVTLKQSFSTQTLVRVSFA